MADNDPQNIARGEDPDVVLNPLFARPGEASGLSDLTVQRTVVRNGLGRDLADDLLEAPRAGTAYLDSLDGSMARVQHSGGFAH